MTLTLPKTVSMGSSKTGLVDTIGITLLNPDGSEHTARNTSEIYEIGGGCYGKEITFPDNWSGAIKWDTNGASPVYATEDYDIEGLIDMIEENVSEILEDTNEIQGKLPQDYIAGSVNDSSLEGKHGNGNWEGLNESGVRNAILSDSIKFKGAEIGLLRKFQSNRLELVSGSVNNWTLYDDDNSPLLTFSVTDRDGNAIAIPAQAPARRSKAV